MKVAFIHPDLGIGGAERLVLDAALGLQEKGHQVAIYTSYRDYNHCFEEARDGTIDVRVRGDTMVPANIGGRLSILCAIGRQIHLAMTLLMDEDQFDVIFIDQLSAAIPLLQYNLKAKIIYYCHFPDKLLSSRRSMLKRLYRIPFDMIEGATTGAADTILVNSKYTASIFAKAFPSIKRVPRVLYPCVSTEEASDDISLTHTSRKIILSVNRFERKKDIGLAIRAYAKVSQAKCLPDSVLVIAGGHDARVAENVATLKELKSLCLAQNLHFETLHAPFATPLGLPQSDRKHLVVFMLSIPGSLKMALLKTASLLVYTPAYEHFGIVPLEAMSVGTPVLAQDNGGPRETVQDGATGFLRPADPDAWSKVMIELLQTDDVCTTMGKQAQKIVLEKFGRDNFVQELEEVLELTRDAPAPVPRPLMSGKSVAILVGVVIVGLVLFILFVLMPMEMRERAEMELEAQLLA